MQTRNWISGGRGSLFLMVTFVLFATSLPSLVHGQSDPPSDVPSMTPTVSAGTSMPSQLPTLPGPPARTGHCEVLDGCNFFPTMNELRDFVANMPPTSTLCLCPTIYAPSSNNCATPDVNNPKSASIVISTNKDITIECDKRVANPLLNNKRLIFGCPEVVFGVENGGHLRILGHAATTMTGGSQHSRIVVEQGGGADVLGVTFSDTNSYLNTTSSRQLFAAPNGVGGAIENGGALFVDNCAFDRCIASDKGGAIYSEGYLEVKDSAFTSNAAGEGGAIYATEGTEIENSLFELNAADTAGSENVAGPYILSCNNVGLPNIGDCSTSAAAILRPVWIFIGIVTLAPMVTL